VRLDHSSTTPATSPVAEAFRQHERLVWGMAYRMTGSAAEADDVVQDTFERAMAHPPTRLDEPLRPWLVRVAMNAARDALRRRKQRSYVGPWLPSPVETADDTPDASIASDARYELRESASYAFLLALEALTPPQRAVLLLRDVLDYTVRETSAALSLSEVNVKVIHHRARRAMSGYDRTRRPSAASLSSDTRATLERFVTALLTQDVAGAEACLADGARLISDGGGEYRAALRPVVGPDRIARFFFGLQRKLGAQARFEVRSLNGLPGVVAEYDDPREGWGPRFVMRCDVDADGAIREVHIVVATEKLTAIAPLPPPTA
jgi:RNA polymerase sigma-70 factor (ECF subfamily)